MKKTFDAVEWMRRRRAETDEEDKLLTWEERSRKTADLIAGDPRWERLKRCRRITPQTDRATHAAEP